MSVNHCMDLKKRLTSTEITLPQVFIHGHLLGVSEPCSAAVLHHDDWNVSLQDADTIETLNETGELRKLLKPFQVKMHFMSLSLYFVIDYRKFNVNLCLYCLQLILSDNDSIIRIQ